MYTIGAAFLAFLAIGMPIFVVLGLTAIFLFQLDGAPFSHLTQKILDELNTELLVSLPFFGMAAVFMQKGGTAKAMLDFAGSWVGSVRGGMGLVAVGGCALFAAIAGSSVATALAMTALLYPTMIERGYPEDFSAGVLAGGATLGILIPPSLPLILYAILASESVPRLFLAGVVPGLLQAALIALYVYVVARKKGFPAEPRLSRQEFWRANLHALPAMSVPVIVAVGIYGGFVTVTESAVLAALVSFLIGLFVYRGFTLTESVGVIAGAMRSAASVVIIVAMALVLGHWVTMNGAPARLVTMINTLGLTSWQFLLAINAILLLLGVFLVGASIMLITVPLLVPMLKPLGIDPVHFAIIIVVNLEIALIHPPVGLNLFVLSNVAKIPVTTVIRGAWPMVLMFIAYLMLISYVPEISLWLPNYVYGSKGV